MEKKALCLTRITKAHRAFFEDILFTHPGVDPGMFLTAGVICEDRPIAAGVLALKDDSTGINSIYTRESYRGLGAGKLLVHAFTTYSRSAGKRAIEADYEGDPVVDHLLEKEGVLLFPQHGATTIPVERFLSSALTGRLLSREPSPGMGVSLSRLPGSYYRRLSDYTYRAGYGPVPSDLTQPLTFVNLGKNNSITGCMLCSVEDDTVFLGLILNSSKRSDDVMFLLSALAREVKKDRSLKYLSFVAADDRMRELAARFSDGEDGGEDRAPMMYAVMRLGRE